MAAGNTAVYAWRKLGLIEEDGTPTRRGVIFSCFKGGEGLAIAAALEDELRGAFAAELHQEGVVDVARAIGFRAGNALGRRLESRGDADYVIHNGLLGLAWIVAPPRETGAPRLGQNPGTRAR